MITLRAGRINKSDIISDDTILPQHLALNPSTENNPGNAGGTITTFTLGNIRIATGTTRNITGKGEHYHEISFPSGFFKQKPDFMAFMSQAAASVGGNDILGNSVDQNSAKIYWKNTTGNASVGGAVSWIAIGS